MSCLIIYHGSNVEVRDPKIMAGRKALDFGQAFYMTSYYEQAKKCYCVIQTGETAIYANIILQKGVVK